MDQVEQSSQQRVAGFAVPSVDGERLIGVFRSLVDHLGKIFPSATEVILHDLSRLPNSISAISGNLTGRAIGGPATDYLLKKVQSGDFEDETGYETRLPDGRRLRSSTMIIRDVQGTPVAALCVNVDLSALRDAQAVISNLLGEDSGRPLAAPVARESFPQSVEELSRQLLDGAIAAVGVAPAAMKKAQKIEVVRMLERTGFFLIREGAETAARELSVSKFTIYNYRNAIAEEDASEQRPTAESA